MADVPFLGSEVPDTGVFQDLIGNQITAATAPSIGTQLAWVISDAGSNRGIHIRFSIPDNYGSSPTLRIVGILDGAPGANDVLSFGFRKLVAGDNATSDGTYGTEQTVSVTIGSSGQNYSDEDLCILTINLTAGDYSANQEVFGWLYIHATNTTYAGNFLLVDGCFRYTPA